MLMGLISALLYACAGTWLASRLMSEKPPAKLATLLVCGVAILLHLITLSQAIFIEPGQNMSMTNVASLIAWLIALSMTLASTWLPGVFLLPVVMGFAAIVVLLNTVIPNTYIMHIEVNPALLVHITLALFAYGCLMIALLYALQLGYINKRLKLKKASLIHSALPPLMAVEQVFFKLLLAGTVLLTLSLISGFTFLDGMFAKDQAHKTLLSMIAWCVFAAVLVAHSRWGVRGKPVISATIVGSILLTLAYFGSRFVKEVLLN